MVNKLIILGLSTHKLIIFGLSVWTVAAATFDIKLSAKMAVQSVKDLKCMIKE